MIGVESISCGRCSSKKRNPQRLKPQPGQCRYRSAGSAAPPKIEWDGFCGASPPRDGRGVRRHMGCAGARSL